MSKNYAVITQFVLPLTTFYRSGAQKSNVYIRDVFVTSWRFHNRAWQPRRHDRLPETSGTLWIHWGALINQRCSLATGCGITSQITNLMIVYSIVYSDADQRKHQSSVSLAFVRWIHRGPVNSPHKWPVTRKMFPFDDVIMNKHALLNSHHETNYCGYFHMNLCHKWWTDQFKWIRKLTNIMCKKTSNGSS